MEVVQQTQTVTNKPLYVLTDGRYVVNLLAPKNGFHGPLLWLLDDNSYLISGSFTLLPIKSLDKHEVVSNHSVVDMIKSYHNSTCIAHEKLVWYLYDIGGNA